MKKSIKFIFSIIGCIFIAVSAHALLLNDVDVAKKRTQASSAVASYGRTQLSNKKPEDFFPDGRGIGYIDYNDRLLNPAPPALCKHKYIGTESFVIRGIGKPVLKMTGNGAKSWETEDQLSFPNPGIPVVQEINTILMEVFYYNDLKDDEKKEEALFKLKDLMLRIRKQEYFKELIPDGPVYGYQDTFENMRETLVLIIQGYAIARDSKIVSSLEEKQLHDWIEKLVASTVMLYNEGADERGSLLPGIHPELKKGLVFALWGSVANDNLYYQAGIKSFMVALAQSRADGSHQFEVRDIRDSSERSSNGLRKHLQVVGFMSMIAEIAKNNGQDLYELRTSNGVSLYDMQKFLAYASLNDIDLPYIKSIKMQRYYLLSKDSESFTLAWYVPVFKKTNVNIFNDYFNTSINYQSLGYGGALNCFIR
jgi:hypothetical protein